MILTGSIPVFSERAAETPEMVELTGKMAPTPARKKVLTEVVRREVMHREVHPCREEPDAEESL